jgi:seryl-tRNA synthetase
MIDIKWLRENPDAFDAALARRGAPPASSSVLAADEERRAVETLLQEGQAERNRLSREIGEAKRQRDEAGAAGLMARMAALKDSVKDREERLHDVQARVDTLLAGFPNVLAGDVPDGPDESTTASSGAGASRAGSTIASAARRLGARLGMDFAAAAKLSGPASS